MTLKSSNLSANVGLGAFLINHLQVSINYNFALGKTGEIQSAVDAVSGITNAATGKTKVKNNAWQIAVAYYF